MAHTEDLVLFGSAASGSGKHGAPSSVRQEIPAEQEIKMTRHSRTALRGRGGHAGLAGQRTPHK